jgi:hypothetical protein
MMTALKQRGVGATVQQVRWAIVSGKVARPPLDGSLRFDFRDHHLEELCRYFSAKASNPTKRCNAGNA